MVPAVAFAAIRFLAVLLPELARLNAMAAALLWLLAGYLAVRFLPGPRWRGLLRGVSFTLVGTALLAHMVAGRPWLDALLLGVILSLTSPLFAAVVVGGEAVVQQLDGVQQAVLGGDEPQHQLIVPALLPILAAVAARAPHVRGAVGEVVLGMAFIEAIPWAEIRLQLGQVVAAVIADGRLSALPQCLLGLTLVAIAARPRLRCEEAPAGGSGNGSARLSRP
jgi:hypothetical protein